MQSTSVKHPRFDNSSLLEQFAKGNSQSFWYLWQANRDYLYNRCLYWMGGNSEKASESLSLIMLRSWDKLPKQAENITDLKGWLTRLTDNLCIDINQKQKKAANDSNHTEKNPNGREEDLILSGRSLESLLLDRDINLYICATIDRLPDELREPFALHYYYQKKSREIANELSLSESIIGKRIQQAQNLFDQKVNPHLSNVHIPEGRERQEKAGNFVPRKNFFREKFLSFINSPIQCFS